VCCVVPIDSCQRDPFLVGCARTSCVFAFIRHHNLIQCAIQITNACSMAPKRADTSANAKRKRGAALPHTPPQTRKRTRHSKISTTDDVTHFLADVEFRASPDPFVADGATPCPSARLAGTLAARTHECAIAGPRSIRDPSAALPLARQHRNHEVGARSNPNRSNTLRVRLRDVVQLWMRRQIVSPNSMRVLQRLMLDTGTHDDSAVHPSLADRSKSRTVRKVRATYPHTSRLPRWQYTANES